MHRFLFLTACALLLMLPAHDAMTQSVPGRVSFTARLVDDGTPVTGTADLGFAIFDAASGGTMVWQEAHSSTPVDDGLLFVELGSTPGNEISPAVLASPDVFLEVTVDGAVQSPRIPILSVPFSTRAEVALRRRARATPDAERAGEPGATGGADVHRTWHRHA